MINGNDGGVDISLNGGETWYAPPLPISQFYRIGVDTRNPYHVSGTMQDLGCVAGPSNSLSGSGIALADWYDVGGGETGYTVSRPDRPEHRLRRRVRRRDHPLRSPHAPGPDGERLRGQPVGPRRGGHEVPLPLAGPDRRLAARPEGHLSRGERPLPDRATAARPGRRSAAT